MLATSGSLLYWTVTELLLLTDESPSMKATTISLISVAAGVLNAGMSTVLPLCLASSGRSIRLVLATELAGDTLPRLHANPSFSAAWPGHAGRLPSARSVTIFEYEELMSFGNTDTVGASLPDSSTGTPTEFVRPAPAPAPALALEYPPEH